MMSTARLTTVNMIARKITDPNTMGISFDLMESTMRRPRPGQENTVSVSMAPPKRVPNCRPTAVIIGIMAFLSMWRVVIFLSETPFALAVSM